MTIGFRKYIYSFCTAATIAAVLSACDGTKFVPEGNFLLKKNKIVSSDDSVNTDGLSQYLRQKTNTKWFSVFSVPLGVYSMAGRDSTKAVNRRLKKWGEAPVILDTTLVLSSCQDINTVIKNRGYLNSTVVPEIKTKGKRAEVAYIITPGEKYTLQRLSYNIADKRIDSLLRKYDVLHKNSLLAEGNPFSVNDLYSERNRITNWLNDHGYYHFNKEHITFVADSSVARRTVDVQLNIGLYRASSRDSLTEHRRYKFGTVTYSTLLGQKLNLRQNVLLNNCILDSGDYYCNTSVQQTYNRFARLKALRSTNIHLTERVEASDTMTSSGTMKPSETSDGFIDANIQLLRRKPHSIQVQPEGTNTAGDLGAALSVTYENRNIFHGSEQLSITARGAFEAIHELEGYERSNYKEFGVEAKLTIPRFILFSMDSHFERTHEATMEIPVSYNTQQRPEFHRSVTRAAWRFKWNSIKQKVNYSYDLIDLYYIQMPWISDTFKKNYLDNESSRNAILRYNYEDLLIMKMGFGVNYTDKNNSIKTSIETAGNILYGLSSLLHFPMNDLGQYKVAKVAFAQYVKMDVDYTHLFLLDSRNTLALHGRVGVAVPYANSTMIPFEKRYFAGGANSVRGWSVRNLGPGRFIGKDGQIDFINQTGDIKIDLNAELRSSLFWKFQGAVFVDAGNIWTIRQYPDQPDGFFKWRSLYDEMAVAYGIGLRLNFDYFLLRLDLGMKAVNPAYTTSEEHFPIAHPRFIRDYALHFAVGLPF